MATQHTVTRKASRAQCLWRPPTRSPITASAYSDNRPAPGTTATIR
jgi:hypothetical protein